VSALQVREEERVSAILGDAAAPRFGYDESQQQRLADIDRKLLKMAAPDVADELIASFGGDRVCAAITNACSGAKARADAEASRFLLHEQQRRQEQARMKDVNAQLRSIMELEQLAVYADSPPPELPPGCRLVPKSRDDAAPLVVVAAPSAIQALIPHAFPIAAVLTPRLRSFCWISGGPRVWAILQPGLPRELRRGLAAPVPCCPPLLQVPPPVLVACAISQYCAELDALLASRGRSIGTDFDHQRELEFPLSFLISPLRHQVHPWPSPPTLPTRSPRTKKMNLPYAWQHQRVACT
jgi:hypothetical protein